MADSAKHSRRGDRVLPRLLNRLRTEFELAVLVSFGVLATLVIAAMAVYRIATGHLVGGLVNSGIALSILTVVCYALFGRSTRLAAILFVLIASAGCLLSALVLGRTGLLWSYVVLWINSLLVNRQLALAVNLMLVAILGVQGSLFESGPEHLSFTVTALLVAGYGYIHSRRFAAQRQMLEEMASLDPLTGAGNRRLLKRDLNAALLRSRLQREPCTLVVMDIDRFKQVNDRFGHEAGDDVLERFVRHVRSHMRSGDSLYRMGGEEFVLLLPGMDRDSARQALPELHARLSGTIAGPAGPVHFSAGAATLSTADDWSRWLARADTAMYKAKRAGRNRIEFAEP